MKKSKIVEEPTTNEKGFTDKCLEIVEEFNSDKCLDGASALFYNRVGLFMMKDSNGKFDAIGDFMIEIDDISDLIPYSGKIILSGLRLEIQTKSDLPREIIEQLNERCLVLGTSIPDMYSRDQTYTTTVHLQTPDWHRDDFDQFLRTYYDFLKEKYKTMNQLRSKKNGQR